MDINQQYRIVSEFRRIQIKYDALLNKVIEGLEERALKRQSDFKECEELSRFVGRTNNRWRRTTSLMVEAHTEFRNELEAELNEINALENKLNEHKTMLDNVNTENESLKKLIETLQERINNDKRKNK